MKSKVIILTAVAAVILIGVGAYFVLAGDNSKSDSNETSSTSSNQGSGEESDVQGSLQSLRGDGKARVCTMSYSGSDGSGNGVMYTDGKGRGRMQIDLVTERGNAGQSNTIMTGDKVYSWTKTDSGSFGMVFDVSAIQSSTTGSPTTSNSQTAGKDFSMKCKSWNVDESVLTVPSDVKFTTLPTSL